jgi:hypothetical protein
MTGHECRHRLTTDPSAGRNLTPWVGAQASGGVFSLGSVVGIEARRKGWSALEQWAVLRRDFVRGVSIKELARRTRLSRNTVRAALRSPGPPRHERAPTGSKLDPFKDEIHRLLGKDATFKSPICLHRGRALMGPCEAFNGLRSAARHA